jgi:hypothetical protein
VTSSNKNLLKSSIEGAGPTGCEERESGKADGSGVFLSGCRACWRTGFTRHGQNRTADVGLVGQKCIHTLYIRVVQFGMRS